MKIDESVEPNIEAKLARNTNARPLLYSQKDTENVLKTFAFSYKLV